MFSKIYSPIVEISSDLDKISSELVLKILELLIISTFETLQKTAVHTLILLFNEPLIELLNFVSIKIYAKIVIGVTSLEQVPIKFGTNFTKVSDLLYWGWETLMKDYMAQQLGSRFRAAFDNL